MNTLILVSSPWVRKDYETIAGSLYEAVWRPFENSVKKSKTIFVGTDGGLNLVSFAGLISRSKQYLIEKHAVHYVSTGRDLVWFTSRLNRSASGLLVLADPDYDADARVRLASRQALLTENTRVSHVRQNRSSDCEPLDELNAKPLPGTIAEAKAIGSYWRTTVGDQPADIFLRAGASEENFKALATGRRVIHLATHGYFLQPGCRPVKQDGMVAGENPMLRSGLLLAGANLRGAGANEFGTDDGIVTALEVSAMNLHGTDLVVLSACETGLGKVEQGEGVYGLRRAFQMAGAKTVVSSLWKIPDKETMQFMKTLYSTKAKTYPELMQQVALKRIREARLRGRPTHPFTWGAFVATGDWRIH